MQIHEMTHTGEKPFKFTECDMSFSPTGHFNIHKRIHMVEKPYRGTKCDKNFSDGIA